MYSCIHSGRRTVRRSDRVMIPDQFSLSQSDKYSWFSTISSHDQCSQMTSANGTLYTLTYMPARHSRSSQGSSLLISATSGICGSGPPAFFSQRQNSANLSQWLISIYDLLDLSLRVSILI